MLLQSDTHRQIKELLTASQIEAGGILGERDGVVCCFEFDEGEVHDDCAVYVPNVYRLNKVIARWHKEGVQFCGIVHSHPAGQNDLSRADVNYIREIMIAMPKTIGKLYFPVVPVDGEMIPYIACRMKGEVKITSAPLQIIKTEKEI